MSTMFEDIGGNSFGLVGIDRATQEAGDRRRALAEKAEAERRAAQELEIAKQVQARLFPQTLPPRKQLDYYGVCLQARQVGGDYYDFLDLGGQHLRKGNRCRSPDGQFAGKFAQPVHRGRP